MALPEARLDTMPTEGPLVDRFGRQHTYLRLSVTDRCNFRCLYCMPAEGLDWHKRDDLLSYEEMTRVVRIFASMGITHVRLTGGEPTVRRDLDVLMRSLSSIDGIEQLAMTTNAGKLANKAQLYADAGLNRVNISLDSLDPEVFTRITRGGQLDQVLAGIEAARVAGLTPIKINCVVVAGENDHEVERLVEYFLPYAADTQVRFIEYMPFTGVGTRRRHRAEVELRKVIDKRWGLEPVTTEQGRGPATHHRTREGGLVVGFISPITQHFCHTCNRLRLQCTGELRTCLSRDNAPSLRDLLRQGASDDALALAIRGQLWGKVAGHEAHTPEGHKAFEGVRTRVGG
jgi:cyclic pyranopterin phosphate synthase